MTQTSTRFTFPDEQVLVIRPSFNTICCKVRPAAKVLSYLCYQYNNNKNPQLDENGGFIVRRTQADLVEAICGEMDVKTLHDTAIPWLLLLGFIDLAENQGTAPNEYILYPDKVQSAIDLCKQPAALQQWLLSNSRLELFLIKDLPIRLEKVLIVDKKKFQTTLEKVLIEIGKSSNHKRGRKPKLEAGLEGKSEPPKISIDNIKINSKKVRATATASAPTLTPTQPSLLTEVPEKKATRNQKTEKPPKEVKKTGLDVLTEQEQTFWNLWLQVDQNKKVPPQYKDSASDHVKALAPQIATLEDAQSLTERARKELGEQLKREVWRVELGNLRRAFPGWDKDRQQPSTMNTDQTANSFSYKGMSKPDLIAHILALPTGMKSEDPKYKELQNCMMYLTQEERRDVTRQRMKLQSGRQQPIAS